MKLKMLLTASISLLPMATMAQEKPKIEGIHHWVSESEVKALKVITDKLATKGYTWQDSAVGGLSGANALQALRTRLAAGNPPTTMQFLGFEGLDWANEGVLRSLNELYEKNGWEKTISPQLEAFVKNGDDYISVPINMHRQNWIWANKALFDKNGISEPKSWDDVIAAGEKLKAAGVVPLAMGDEPWQILEVFEAIATDMNGPEFYKKAIVDLDEDELSSDKMVKTFDMLRKVRGLVDDGFTGRDWAVASAMVADGKAGMQVMGDWAKGEFLNKGLKPGSDFLCFPTPAQTPYFKFVIDAFGLFKTSDEAVVLGQDAWAESVMDPQVQRDFNKIKGSIPARIDISVSDFDTCAQRSFADRDAAQKNDTMLGGLTEGFANQPQFTGVFSDVVAKFFTTDMSSKDAVKALVDGINNAK
ncbi:carbohydrate ABC transporter substrate-binding protein [Rhizobium sp. J15]|uniref:ABC transporter substrate-binding protein n=1 Tax=unclassified Rhizobium TaxID=2613769 RepID=UPI000A1D6353|nr:MULTISPECIES: ABC transporter substrate-binding protein [unclassified Rhizobium]ARM92256.1 sugar ABC transporter substrate-binding protein [Rhizobium sp. CIAT894]PDT14416.1 carbohydrate ABC transporter substrate-binding protein [Rhizobium sp. J15]